MSHSFAMLTWSMVWGRTCKSQSQTHSLADSVWLSPCSCWLVIFPLTLWWFDDGRTNSMSTHQRVASNKQLLWTGEWDRKRNSAFELAREIGKEGNASFVMHFHCKWVLLNGRGHITIIRELVTGSWQEDKSESRWRGRSRHLIDVGMHFEGLL